MFSSSTATAVAILAIDFACLIKLVAQCARLGGQAPATTTSNQRHNVYRDVVCLYYSLLHTTTLTLLPQSIARQKRACYVDWIIGRMPPPPLRFWVGENQTHQICLITSLPPPRKQSSAFSNIEAILSIMAKVSLSRQMSRKYMLHRVRCMLALAGKPKQSIPYMRQYSTTLD